MNDTIIYPSHFRIFECRAGRWFIKIEGITKVLAIDRAKNFYLNIGFQQNPEYPRELILTKEAALAFLQDQLDRRGEQL